MQACDEEVDAEEFVDIPLKPKDKTGKPTYYQRNRDQVIARNRKYYQDHKEEIARRRAQKYSQNPEKVLSENKARKKFNAALYGEEQAVIAQARKARGLRQADLGQMIGVGIQTICRWENGYCKANWAKLEAALPELRERRKRDAFVVSG